MRSFLNKLLKRAKNRELSTAKQQDIKSALEGQISSILSGKAIEGLAQVTSSGEVYIALEVSQMEANTSYESLRQEVERCSLGLDGVQKAHVVLTAKAEEKVAEAPKSSPSPPPPPTPKQLPHVKRVIMVASGKGGVGKSTVCANLAVAFAQQGLSVGLMDADIYGPSQPIMMGISGQKPDGSQGHIEPIIADNGVKVMSIGLMVDTEKALIWRGPIVQKALLQLTFDVAWGSEDAPLDILLIDMPPGTGDIPLSLAQKVVIDGAVIVSTPQDIALTDVRRGIAMFAKTDIPILGVIENMSTHICSACGHEDHVFGHGGARLESEKLNVSFLGSVPLSAAICHSADMGDIKPDESFLDLAGKLK